MLKEQKRQKGFTLTELIIVIVISGIFLTLLSTIIVNFSRHYTDAKKNGERLDEIALIEDIYADLFNKANVLGREIKQVVESTVIKFTVDVDGQMYEITYDSATKKILYNSQEKILKYIESLTISTDNDNVFIEIISNGKTYEKVFNSVGGVTE